MKRIRYRLLLRTVFVFGALMAVFSVSLIAFSFDKSLESEKRHIKEEAQALNAGLSGSYVSYRLQGGQPDEDTLQTVCSQLNENASLEKADAEEDACLTMKNRSLILETDVALGKERYRVTITRSVAAIYDMRDALKNAYRILYLIFVPLSAALVYRAGRSVTGPIEALTDAANALSAGDYTVRTNIHSPDETGALSQAFDKMAGSVQGEIEKRESLIGSLTHEMKTPIQAIIGHTDLMLLERYNKEETLLALKTVQHEAARLNKLSMRMMDWVRLQEDAVAVRAYVHAEDLLKNVQSAFETRANVRLVKAEGAAWADHVLMETLISNLVDNAVNAGADEILLSAERAEGGIRFTVTDNGSGMNEETLLHLEEPFYREDKARTRAHGGAGLGLSLCARIAQAHDTRIHYESEKGKGTRVSLTVKEAKDG